MKIQILYLDPHDDYASTRDKLNWAKSPRVVLVWPGRGQVLSRKIDLVLLQRYARDHGSTIGIVCHDVEIREQAIGLGIPVFDSLDEVSERAWYSRMQPRVTRRRDRPDFQKPRPRSPPTMTTTRRILRILFIAIPLVLTLLLFLSLLPTADIYLAPAVEEQALNMSVDIEDPPRSNVEGIRRASTIVEGSLRRSTTGVIEVPVTYADGEVQFENLTDQVVLIPQGTVVTTGREPSMKFGTTRSIELEPSEGAVEIVPVRALQPGSSSNIGAGEIEMVEGALGELVLVSNLEEFSGGTEEDRSAVTRDDIEEIKNLLTEELLNQAAQVLAADLSPSEDFVDDSWTVLQTIEESLENTPGEPADTTSLTVKQEISVIIIDPPSLLASFDATAKQKVPSGYVSVPGSFELVLVTSNTSSSTDMKALDLQFRQTYRVEIAQEEIVQEVRLRPIEAAQLALLSRFELNNPPEIVVHPGWLPWLPWNELAFQVHYPEEKLD